MKSTTRPLLIVLLAILAVSVVAIYWAGLQGSFIFDDFPNIVHNPALHAFDGSTQSLITAATSGTAGPLGRPLTMATFALNFYFFGDLPFSFKLTNLAVHIANSMLIYLWALQVWRRLGHETDTTRAQLPALWIAAVWALHPINLTPVLFIVQRMTSLSAFFMLAALTLYLYGRTTKNIKGYIAIGVSTLVCWPAAILSKETGLLLPIYVFLMEWLLLGTFRTVPVKGKWFALTVLGASASALSWVARDAIIAGYGVRDFGMTERLLTETRVLWFYLRQGILPTPELFGLFHDDVTLSRGLLIPPTTLLAIVGWLALVAFAAHQRSRRPLIAFGVLWFLASHLLESTILPLEIAYEHRNYMAFLGIFVWIASLLFTNAKGGQWQLPRISIAISLVLFCGLVTGLRSQQWANELQRAQVEVAHHPDSARANYQVASAVMHVTYELGVGSPSVYKLVQMHYKRAADLDKSNKAALIGLLYLDCAAGVPKEPVIQIAARERFADSRFTFGDRAVVQSLSGLLLENRLCLDDLEVKALIESGLSNRSADGSMRGLINAVAMDYAAVKMHDLPLAMSYAQAAVASDPGSIPLGINRIHLYIQSKQMERAHQEYLLLAARKIPPRDMASMNELKAIFDAMERNANRQKPAG